MDRAEIDLPDDVGDYDERVYAKARENFLKLQHDGVLVRESAPCLYLYRQVMGKHAQVGLVAAAVLPFVSKTAKYLARENPAALLADAPLPQSPS